MNNKVFEITKWVLIVFMSIAIIVLLRGNRELKSSYQASMANGTYVSTYQSQTISQLKKSNAELYDSIKHIKNVKQAAIIKYKYVYNGDTVYIPRQLAQINDSTYKTPKDSVYTMTENSDTLSYKLFIKANSLYWYKLNFTLNEKLTIVNREENGQNQTTIGTSTAGGAITGTENFNQKTNANNFFNRFTLGVQVGAGYGLINRKPDLYVGFGVTYRLNKIK